MVRQQRSHSFKQCDYLFSDCEKQRSDNYILHIWVTQKEQECLYTSHRGWGYFGILKCTYIVCSWCFLVDWQTKFIKGITLVLFSFSIWTFWLLFKLNTWAFIIFPSNFTSFWLLLKVLERSTGWGRPPLPHWYQEELRWCCLQPKHWQHWGRGHWRGQGHRSKQSRRSRHNCQTHCRR